MAVSTARSRGEPPQQRLDPRYDFIHLRCDPAQCTRCDASPLLRSKHGLARVAGRHVRMLAKLTIARRAIARIRVDLGTCGIRDTSVFPDLEGLSRELLRLYTEPS